MAISAGLLLAACAGEADRPAPVAMMGAQGSSVNGAAIVQQGDTLWTIAQRYNLPLRDIIDINNLSAPYPVAAGQRLVLPAPLEHKVGAKDTLYRISHMYDVPLSQLVKTNRLSAPYNLKVGETLRIPSTAARVNKELQERPQVASSFGSPVDVPDAPSVNGFAVLKNDARIETEDLAAPKTISEKSPASASTVAPVTEPKKQTAQMTSTGYDKGLQRETSSVIGKWASMKENDIPARRPTEPRAVETTLASAGRDGFIWPVRGKVISNYGPKDRGLYNDGINIAVPKGSPVSAAADGVVVYVGNKLQSYGNLVLIRHGNGVTTAYAHLYSSSVSKGMRVRKGQTIGTVGTSGTVATSQLHFEIRKGNETLDPKKFLG